MLAVLQVPLSVAHSPELAYGPADRRFMTTEQLASSPFKMSKPETTGWTEVGQRHPRAFPTPTTATPIAGSRDYLLRFSKFFTASLAASSDTSALPATCLPVCAKSDFFDLRVPSDVSTIWALESKLSAALAV